jgi:hypothetical protein
LLLLIGYKCGMIPQYQQEFECSFEAAIKGGVMLRGAE